MKALALASSASSFPTGVDAIVLVEPIVDVDDTVVSNPEVELRFEVIGSMVLLAAVWREDNKGSGEVGVGLGVELEEFLWQLLKLIACCGVAAGNVLALLVLDL